MKRLAALLLLASLTFTSAEVLCIGNKCGSTEPILDPVSVLEAHLAFDSSIDSSKDSSIDNSKSTDSENRGAISFGDGEENIFDVAIDPLAPIGNNSPEAIFSLHIKEFISFSDIDDSGDAKKEDEQSVQKKENILFPNLPGDIIPQLIFGFWRFYKDAGVLDLSWKNITGNELLAMLLERQMSGRPVLTLILSNARVYGLTSDTFQPVQDTLQELHMDNCSVALGAFTRLSNLRFLNLSHNGLAMLEWFPQLSNTLEVLDLSHNSLAEVKPELGALKSLKELITSVDEYPLALLTNLKVVSLTMNSINNVNLASLINLQVAELDWNYLWRFGYEALLPAHRLSLRLSSNPWRCDCGILQARDDYDVLDLDNLQCSNSESFAICDGCMRHYLPRENAEHVENQTKDSIEHLGCTGLLDQMYLARQELANLSKYEPYKLYKLGVVLLLTIVLFIVLIVVCCRSGSKKQLASKAWLKIQDIPHLTVHKLKKPQEVPYIKV